MTPWYRYACPLFPRQLTRTKHTARAWQIFCGELSFRLTHSFASVKFKKKEKMSSIPTPWFVLCSPLRGHRFIGTRSPISFETLSKELFEPGLLSSRPKLLKVDNLSYIHSSAAFRSSLTKSLAQPSPLLATCSCHMRVRDSNFTQYDILGNTKNGTSHTNYGKAGFTQSEFELYALSELPGNTKDGTQPHQSGL